MQYRNTKPSRYVSVKEKAGELPTHQEPIWIIITLVHQNMTNGLYFVYFTEGRVTGQWEDLTVTTTDWLTGSEPKWR